jgi:mannose/fructose/N-acetylgalactosamine-specific phosphotransferase system component IID
MQFIQKIIEKLIDNIAIILIAAAFLTLFWHFLLKRKKYFFAGVALIFSTFVICIYGGLLSWLAAHAGQLDFLRGDASL